MSHKAAITITYCSQCNWMLRASWMAQELLYSFSTDIASVTLIPGTGRIFVVAVDDVQIWERKRMAVSLTRLSSSAGCATFASRKNRWGTWTNRHNPQEYVAASLSLNVYYECIFFGRNRRWQANVLRGKRPLAA